MEVNAIHLPGLLLALEHLAAAGVDREHAANKALQGLIDEAEVAWACHAATGACATENTVLQALAQAEQFVVGFEDDELQSGIGMLLAQLRSGATVAEQWRAFIDECAGQAGGMVNGNRLSLRAAELLALPACPEVAGHG